MRGFATSNNPYTGGMRPKRFLEARVQMLRQEKMTSGGPKKKFVEVRKNPKITD